MEVERGYVPTKGHVLHEAQARFTAAAFGFTHPGDRYVKRLDQKEASLLKLTQNVAGCSKIVNGTRVHIESMLRHAWRTFEQELALERSLYVSDNKGCETKTSEEIDALLYSAPVDDATAHAWIDRIRALLGSAQE